MAVRRHRIGDRRAWASFSPCGRWRYALVRTWGAGPRLLCVLLNPSTADAEADDATLTRCCRRAGALGFGALRMVNLFAWRATRPAELSLAADPVGPENDRALRSGAAWADAILCGWGVHGRLFERDRAVLRLLGRRPLWHLGLTVAGQPRHPLYVAAAQPMLPWSAGQGA